MKKVFFGIAVIALLSAGFINCAGAEDIADIELEKIVAEEEE